MRFRRFFMPLVAVIFKNLKCYEGECLKGSFWSLKVVPCLGDNYICLDIAQAKVYNIRK